MPMKYISPSWHLLPQPAARTVLGIKGKYGAVPRNVWVYFLFWGVRPTFAALTKKATKRVCMGEIPNYHMGCTRLLPNTEYTIGNGS